MNNGTINMFAAHKVKLHGMTSSKWTTKDKLTQYKALINLYKRDHKIIQGDRTINRKNLERQLQELQRRVVKDRFALDNALKGGKQQLRHTLSDHRDLQLAYQNSEPEKVAECVQHLIFTKRKELDKLICLNIQKSKKLIRLKEEEALLQDRLRYPFLGQIQQEKDAQIITGRVQDATLKKEAAMAIKQIYKEIIDIMKKDALYYETIITTIENDGFSQSRCFLGATKLGQLATEYMDDRRQEYEELEAIIVQDMEARKTDIRVLQAQIARAASGFKELLRRESDINTCSVRPPNTPSMENLRKEAAVVESALSFLKKTTLCTTYEQIYPCLEEQQKQKKRLTTMTQKCERDKDILLNRLNHGEMMLNMLQTTMVETTGSYKRQKSELTETIDHFNKQRQQNLAKIEYKHKLVANMRIALRQLYQLSKVIVKMEGSDVKKVRHTAQAEYSTTLRVPEKDEHDGCKIIRILITRFTLLMSTYNSHAIETKSDEAYRMFEAMMVDRLVQTPELIGKGMSEPSLLEGLYTEQSHQLTREDIKKQSEEIVAANTRNDDLVPLTVMPKKRSKFSKVKKTNKEGNEN